MMRIKLKYPARQPLHKFTVYMTNLEMQNKEDRYSVNGDALQSQARHYGKQ